jgi:hypothetical protein
MLDFFFKSYMLAWCHGHLGGDQPAQATVSHGLTNRHKLTPHDDELVLPFQPAVQVLCSKRDT